jgi:hypothetical protein
MKSKSLSLLAIFLWLVGLLIVGCNTSTTATENKYETTPISQVGSGDLTPQSKQVLSTVTTTPILAPTTTISPTSTPLPTVTPSSLPTLSSTEADTIILDLYKNNGECLFPCFWGFMPGQTKWETVKQTVAPFAYLIDFGNSKPSEGNLAIAYVYVILSQVSSVPMDHLYGVENGIITTLDVPLLALSNNTPQAILESYGKPSEIWLLTASVPMDDVLGFRLSLFYAEHHFMLTYSNWDGEVINGKVRGCISGENESLHLVAWSPEKKLTSSEAIYGLHKPHRQIIYDLPIEEATGISVASFYETFKDSNEPICLETPAKLWPNP